MWLFHHLVNVLDLAFYDTHSMKTGRCYLLKESKTTFLGSSQVAVCGKTNYTKLDQFLHHY